jgi:hypothetical protein
MYFLAKSYNIPRLCDISFQKLITSTSLGEFGLDQILWTIEYLYITALWLSDRAQPDVNARKMRKPRMRVVYLAQKCDAIHLSMKPKFKYLMGASAAFIWDYTTKCFQARWLQCREMDCEAIFEPRIGKGECDCGGEGVCEACVAAKGEVQMPMCGKCGKAKLGRWDVDFVDSVDIESVKALGEMFHPA